MTHLNRGRRSALILAAAAALLGPVAHAQSPAWPQRPVRLVVPYGPGSSPDVMARILAERLAPRLGQPVVVENRAGAGGNVGTGAVARATPDGHTLVISTNGPLVNNTVLYGKLPYDPFRELAPVILAGGQANVCAVRADAGIGSMKELVAAMRARPGSFNFSSIGVGSLSHLGVELLKARTGSFAVHIPYPSSPAAITAVLQGDVQFSCVPAVAVMPQVRAGRLRALAVSTGTRSALMPEIPTLKEAGFPDVEAVAWMAVLAPAGTPADVIGRLNREMNAVLALPEVRERMHSQYMEPIGGSPEQLARFMQDELRIWTPIIRRSGATIE
ncbi:MAG: tripartite tricarboxylate transporter substrate binding protein [Burkholderiales bacterium]